MIIFTLKNALKTRLLIAEHGSLRQFSKKVGLSHCYLSQILTGKRNPSPFAAYKIASGLSLKIEDIFLSKLVDNQTNVGR